MDDHLVKPLTNFPVSVNHTDIRFFCGLVQQFQSFSHRLTELLAPIQALLSPKSEFTWEAPHQEAFEQVIRELASPRVLANFMPSRLLRLETDAAQSKGLRTALWQQPAGDWCLLQCGSRHVTAAESRYSATEVAPDRCVGHPKSPPLPRRVQLRTPCRPPATHPTSQLEDTRRDAVTTPDTPEGKAHPSFTDSQQYGGLVSSTRSLTVSHVILSLIRPQATVRRLTFGRCYSEPTQTAQQATISCRSWILI